jgi:very-short-patch-repair endonuclease
MADQLARTLRRSMTSQEVKLWVRLRELRRQGYHFRRQAPRGRYILDFTCLRSRLVVEVDGAQHGFDAHAARDATRDGYFTERGFRTLRFWNNEIDRNLDGRSRRSGMPCRVANLTRQSSPARERTSRRIRLGRGRNATIAASRRRPTPLAPRVGPSPRGEG